MGQTQIVQSIMLCKIVLTKWKETVGVYVPHVTRRTKLLLEVSNKKSCQCDHMFVICIVGGSYQILQLNSH